MTVQCKTCQKVHVNGEWTEADKHQCSNLRSFCPACYSKFKTTQLDPSFDLGKALMAR